MNDIDFMEADLNVRFEKSKNLFENPPVRKPLLIFVIIEHKIYQKTLDTKTEIG